MATVTVGSLPNRVDLTVLAGEALELSVPILDGAGAPVPAADLASARAQVRKSIDDPTVLHTFTGSITGTTAAVVVLSATSAVTSGWQSDWPGTSPRTVMWWDLEVTDSGGTAHQVTVPGTVTLVWQVTR